jgi:hypothetical protein
MITRPVVDISHVFWHKQVRPEALISLDLSLSFLDLC